jgi:hypothetical protein
MAQAWTVELAVMTLEKGAEPNGERTTRTVELAVMTLEKEAEPNGERTAQTVEVAEMMVRIGANELELAWTVEMTGGCVERRRRPVNL